MYQEIEEKFEIADSDQMPDTPSANIKHFEVYSNKVVAVFWDAKQARDYIAEHSPFGITHRWHDKIGFADFSWKLSEKITAKSTYHPASSMIDMFKNGLKH